MSLIKKIIKLLKGDYDSAISDFTKAIQLNPQHADAYTGRGNAYDKKGNWKDALICYNGSPTYPDEVFKFYNSYLYDVIEE